MMDAMRSARNQERQASPVYLVLAYEAEHCSITELATL